MQARKGKDGDISLCDVQNHYQWLPAIISIQYMETETVFPAPPSLSLKLSSKAGTLSAYLETEFIK